MRADRFADFAALNVGPVTGITEIRYLDLAGTEQLLDPAMYQLVGAELERGIERANGAMLPPMLARRGSLSAQLEVGYGATAAAVPQQLRWAQWALIGAKFNNRSADIETLIVNHRIWS